MAIESDASLIGKGLEWVGAIAIGLVGVVWKMLHGRIDDVRDQASKDHVSNSGEIDRQRDNIAKLFDSLTTFSARAEARHVELLNTMHTLLNSKADK